MALVLPGQESGRDEPGRRLARHHHLEAYAALVIRGTCDEAGDRGRFRARVGDVLLHRPFDAHENAIGHQGAAFLNFALCTPLAGRFGSVADVDAVIRANERDPAEAAALIYEQFRPAEPGFRDWPDMLASDLARGPAARLETWAECHGLHPASVSRGFRSAYGVSPKRFRLEQMASRAARRIRRGSDTLAGIAADAGFADQAHMTRTLRQLFGASPRELRAIG